MRVARLTRVLIAWALLGSCVVGSASAGSVHDARGEALRLYDAGRYQEALPFFDEVLKHKPRDLDSRNKRGCIYIRRNQPLRALVDLDAATRTSPFLAYDAIEMNRQFAPDVHTRPSAWLYGNSFLYPSPFTNRGIALMMLDRDDEALASFQRSISIRLAQPGPALTPSSKTWRIGMAAAFCGVGQVYHRKGDDAQAFDAFDRAIRYNPDDPNGHVGRGEALIGMGQLEKGLLSYNEAVRLDPDHSRALGYRAAAMERVGDDEAALADYDGAIRLDPTATTVRRLRGALLSRLGRNAKAVPDLDEAIRLVPSDAGAYKDRGGVYTRLGEHEKALRDLDEAIRLDPRSAKAFQNRAAAFNGLGQYGRAVRDCDEALRLDPKNAGALNNRGLALSALGRNERALADLTESIRLDPRQVPAYHNRGGARVQLGMFEEAAADYEEVLRRSPGFAPAEAGLAQVRQWIQRRGGTGRDDLAVLEDPSGARRDLDLGHARRAAGDWPGAIAGYTRALEIDPKNSDALAFRGWSRACAGDPSAESDARAWLDLKGWRSPFAPYMALLGLIAARQAGHDQAAGTFLDEALANTRPPAWPAPLFRYLKRTLPSTDVLSAADSLDKRTEARAVIGLDLLHRGERDAAVGHLRWVRDHGLDRSIAKDLARETLRRIEAP